MVLSATKPVASEKKKTYHPPRMTSEKILVPNLFATACTSCTPQCPQFC